MLTPTVTEIPRPLDGVSRDTFIAGAGAAVPSSRSLSRPRTSRPRSIAPAQVVGARRGAHISLAADRRAGGSRATAFAQAA